MWEAVVFLISLAALAVSIMILSLLSSIVQKWISDEGGQASPNHDGADYEHGYSEQPQGKGIVPPSLISRVDAVAGAIYRHSEHRIAHERTQTKTEKITIVVLGVTAGFAFLAAIAAGASAIIFERQLEEMRAEQRPWVGVFGFNVQGDPDPSNGLYYAVQIKNSGKSPAFDVNILAVDPHQSSGTDHIPHFKCLMDCTQSNLELLPDQVQWMRVPFRGKPLLRIEKQAG